MRERTEMKRENGEGGVTLRGCVKEEGTARVSFSNLIKNFGFFLFINMSVGRSVICIITKPTDRRFGRFGRSSRFSV